MGLPLHRGRLVVPIVALSLIAGAAGSVAFGTEEPGLGPEAPLPYQDGYVGAAGYLPSFHPTPLSASEATQGRVAVYKTTPSPKNVQLEYPDKYRAVISCFGRAFDPRGPFADPPRAPYLLPGNISAITFGDAHIAGGGLYVAVAGTGFNDVVSGTTNRDPSKGPIVTPENAAGIYEVGLRPNGRCRALRAVSGGPAAVGTNAGPHPEWSDFGASIDGIAWHNGTLYVNDFTGGPEGAHSGSKFSGGRLHAVDPVTGDRTALIANLPSEGDHQNDAEVFFNDGGHEWLEFEQGTTTNSGTVDGEAFGDIPCYDVKLTDAGKRFFPFTTGYHRTEKNLPGGTPLQQVQSNGDVVVRGTLPCSGSTMAVSLDTPISADGTNASLRLTGFGFRNPYSMVIAPPTTPGIGGELVLTNNDVDVRGQRPLANGGDDVWPFEVNGNPIRNWGWPNQINWFSSADPQFGLANNALAGRRLDRRPGPYTGNQARRSPTQPGQAIIGQEPIFTYLGEETEHITRGGVVPPGENIDIEFVPGISTVTVDISADGIDFVKGDEYGSALADNFFVAGFGNLEFPLGSTPAGLVGKDIRRFHVETTADGKYVGTVQKVFVHNKVQPGGWPNLNTGGLLGPLDLKFSPNGRTLWLADFGSFMTTDSGAVGGFRCDPSGDCANGAKQFGGSGLTVKDYSISIEQFAGTGTLWRFVRVGSDEDTDSASDE